jgi:exonuclease III
LFASRAVAERLVEVEVQNGDADPAWQHSDHAPVIATFEVT